MSLVTRFMLSPFAHARFVLHLHKWQKQAAIVNGINGQKMAVPFQILVYSNLHDGGPSHLNKTHSITCTKDAECISENNLRLLIYRQRQPITFRGLRL